MLKQALESLPATYRPDPDDPGAQQVLVRSDSAGATHTFAAACRTAGVGFSFGYPVDTRVRDAVEILNTNQSWYRAIDSDGDIRDGAWVAEATGLVQMSGWPAGTRLILRKERPHPGAQLRFTDSEGLRVTAFITDTPAVWSQANSADSNCATASTPGWRTGSVKPRPPGCATCPATAPTRTPHGWKSSWPQQIWWPGPNCSDSKTNRTWPRPRSTPSDTGSYTSPPASPAAPDRSDYGSTPPGDGRPQSPNAGTDSAPDSRDHPVHHPTDPKDPSALESPPPSATGRLVMPRCNNQPHKPASTGLARTEPAARKIEAKTNTCSPSHQNVCLYSSRHIPTRIIQNHSPTTDIDGHLLAKLTQIPARHIGTRVCNAGFGRAARARNPGRRRALRVAIGEVVELLTISRLSRWSINYYNETATQATAIGDEPPIGGRRAR